VPPSARALLVVVALCTIQIPADAQPPIVTLSIVGTNDLHGGILPENGHGGLALFAGYVKNLRAARARDGGAVLLVDAGDMWQGTLESNLREGAPVVAAYNALGYTAAAVGNHEFDFGPAGPATTPGASAGDPRGALKARASEASFPFLAANLIDAGTGLPMTWPNVRPSILVETAGIKVGIIGVMTAGGLRQTFAAHTRGLQLQPLAPVIEAEARRLSSAGATVVVVTAHAGGRCADFSQPRDVSSCESGSEIFELARRLPPGLVDAIMAGHTHAGLAHEVRGIPIAEAYSGGRAFSRIDLVVDFATGRVRQRAIRPPHEICSRVSTRTARCVQNGPIARYEGADVVPDREIERLLAPAVAEAAALRAKPVGVTLETPMRRGDDALRSSLGQLFVEAMRQAAKSDVAINNTDGGLRADLPAGPLLYGSLFRTFPFDNQLVVLRVRAADVSRVIAAELRRRSPRVSVSGPRVVASCAGGTLRVRLQGDNGPIADDSMLRVATTDFLALGGDGVFAPVAPSRDFQASGDDPLVRDVVADWLRARAGRLGEPEFTRRAASAWTLPGPLPLNCSR
jgi:2',3'-cyclic-nucleotide 2'-phosphodiesterase (5'-nucleotidase family)